MTFIQLNYIYEVYNCGSINKAAQNLFVSQSSLSSAIRELEEELGIQIFTRSNRGIAITEEGNEFLSQIMPILEQQRKVERYYAQRNVLEPVRLHVSAQRYPFCAKAFVEIVHRHWDNRLEFSFKETEMDRVIENVSQRVSDLGILFLSDITESFMKKLLHNNNLEFQELARIRPHVFIGSDHPLATQTEVSLKDLYDYPYVIFSKKNNSSYNFAEEAFIANSSEFRKILYVNDRATAYNFIANANGFTTGSGLLPEGYSPTEVTSIPIKDDLPAMRLGWIKLKDMPLTPIAQEYMDSLIDIIKG